MAWFRCMCGNGGEEPKDLPYVPSDTNYKISNVEIDALKASIDAYNTANNIAAIDWNSANVICCIGSEVMWDTYSSMTAIKVRYFYIYSSNTVLSTFSTGKNFDNFEIGDSECTLTVNDGTYIRYKVYNRAIGDKYAGWCVNYDTQGSAYLTYFGDDTLIEVQSVASEGNFSYIPGYPAWVSKTFITADSLGNQKAFLNPAVDNEPEIKDLLVQDNIPNPATFSKTFSKNVKYAFSFYGTDDNVDNAGSITVNSIKFPYNNLFSWGLVPIQTNRVITGTFPYSDGGAEFLYWGIVGMPNIPSNYTVKESNSLANTITITLDKTYDHVILMHAFDYGYNENIVVELNGEALTYTSLPSKWGKYTRYLTQEIEVEGTTLTFEFLNKTYEAYGNNKLLIFAYDD